MHPSEGIASHTFKFSNFCHASGPNVAGCILAVVSVPNRLAYVKIVLTSLLQTLAGVDVVVTVCFGKSVDTPLSSTQ